MVTIDDVRAFARTLPRSSEAFVRGRVKFRIGRIVYLSFSRDEAVMGFAFPKDWRDALVESEPEKFSLPGQSDLRYHWVHVRLAAIDADEMRELVEDAWAFTVPRRVAEEYAGSAMRAPDPVPLADAAAAPRARKRARTGSARTSAPPRE
jgi:hypothetical protein